MKWKALIAGLLFASPSFAQLLINATVPPYDNAPDGAQKINTNFQQIWPWKLLLPMPGYSFPCNPDSSPGNPQDCTSIPSPLLPTYTGDMHSSGTTTTNVAINGTTVPASPSADQTINTTGSSTGQWTSLPACLDSGGNHLNYNTSTHSFTCGNTGGSTSSVAFSGVTAATNSSAAMVVGTGASLATSGSGTIAATSVPASGVTGILAVANGGTATATPGLVGAGDVAITGTWPNQTVTGTPPAPAFSAITGSTNTTAAMILGSGSSLAVSGTGTNAATSVPATGITGNLPIARFNNGTGASSSTCWLGNGTWGSCSGGGGGGSAFSSLTTGTNTTATMTIGTGAILGPTGTGVVSSNFLYGIPSSNIFPAVSYNSGAGNTGSPCAFTSTTDNSGCINNAIAAAALTNGTVIIPGSGASCIGISNPIVQANNFVKLYGAGVGYSTTPSASSICATSAFSHTGTLFTLASGANNDLTVVDVVGILFDCKNIAFTGFHATSVSNSRFEVGVANCGDGTYGIANGGAENGIFDTYNGGNGNQNDYLKLYTTSNNYATGWRLDAGGSPGSKTSTNTSQDVIEDVFMVLGHGDGLVLGDVDNIVSWGPIRCQGGCSGGSNGPGRPVVVGNGGSSLGYTSPNGVSTNGSQQKPQIRIYHTSVGVAVEGSQMGSTLTRTAGTGTAVPYVLTLTTSIAPPATGNDKDVLTFTSTNGVQVGMVATCSAGSSYAATTAGPLGSGVPYNDPVLAVTSTTVQLLQPISNKYVPASVITCHFTYGLTATAVNGGSNLVGTYTITYTGTWAITAPSGGNSQSGIGSTNYTNNRVVAFQDVVISVNHGTLVSGDTFTLTVPPQAGAVSVLGTDQGNGIPLASFENGAWGYAGYENQPVPINISATQYPGMIECIWTLVDCATNYLTNNNQGLAAPQAAFSFVGAVPFASTYGGGLNVTTTDTSAVAADGTILWGNTLCNPSCPANTYLQDLQTNGSSVFSVDSLGNVVAAGTISGSGVGLPAQAPGTVVGNFTNTTAVPAAVPSDAITPITTSSGNTQLMICTSNVNITSAAAVLTFTQAGCSLFGSSATPAMTAADVGKLIAVVGAGTSGATLATTITATGGNPACSAGTCTVNLTANAGTTLTNATVLIAWGTSGDGAAINTALTQAAASGGKVGLARRVYGLETAVSIPTTGVTDLDLGGAIVVCLTSLTDEINIPAAAAGLIAGYSSRLHGGGWLEGMGLCGDNVHLQSKGWMIDHLNMRNPTTENILCDVSNCKGSDFSYIDIDNAQPGAPGGGVPSPTGLWPAYGVLQSAGADNHYSHFNVTGFTTNGFKWGSGVGEVHATDLHAYGNSGTGTAFFSIASQGTYSALYVDQWGQTGTGQVGIDILSNAVTLTGSYIYSQSASVSQTAAIRISSNNGGVVVKDNSCNGLNVPALNISPSVPGILLTGALKDTADINNNAGCFIQTSNLSGNPNNAYVTLGGGSGVAADGGGFMDSSATNETSMGAYTFNAPTFLNNNGAPPTYTRGTTLVVPDVATCAHCTAHGSAEFLGQVWFDGTVNFLSGFPNLALSGGLNSDNASTLSIGGTQAATTGGGTSAYGLFVNETFAPNGPTKAQGIVSSPTLDTANGVNITNYNGNSVGIMTIDANYAGTTPTIANYAACNGYTDSRTGGTASNPASSFSCYVANAIGNAAGATTGTSVNYQFNANTATTSGAATGGNVTNAAFRGIVPSGGSTGGTTLNYGLLLTGNGGTNSSGTTTNWGIAYTGTADSELLGGLDNTPIGSVAPSTGAFTQLTMAGTIFTIASGTGACATSGTKVGGSTAGNLTCTGTTGASTITLTLPSAAHAYTCWGRDVTNPTTLTQSGAISTTSVTLTMTSVAANDVIQFGCIDY